LFYLLFFWNECCYLLVSLKEKKEEALIRVTGEMKREQEGKNCELKKKKSEDDDDEQKRKENDRTGRDRHKEDRITVRE